MANYDRQVLVPYLQDVCCVEMLCRKLELDIERYRGEANKFANWANGEYKNPPKPNRNDYSKGDDSGTGEAVVGGVICLIGLFLCTLPILILLGIPAIIVGLIMIWSGLSQDKEASNNGDARYKEAVAVYERKVADNQRNRMRKPEWKATSERWRAQERQAEKNLHNARVMRDKLYSVNIIPSRYRTIHAAYYLYDYFDSCRETDLDKIIQTMLLDEIIKRMDKLIVQNQEILLNQRRQIALQEQQNRAIADNHREEMRRIARMERNQERQLDYQHMIERNQEVTNFFLAADYLERHR